LGSGTNVLETQQFLHMTSDDEQFAIDALQSGDPARLEELAALTDDLSDDEVEVAWQRWILHAVAAAPLATIEWMIDGGVDLGFRDRAGYTPLLAAVECTRADRLDVLRRLIAAGAPLNVKGINDWTPAHMAAARDDVDALALLVDSGADLSIRTGIDQYATPLEEARHLGMAGAVAFLERHAQQPHDEGSPFPGWRALVESGHFLLIQQMLENHGIRVEIAPMASSGRRPSDALWVKAVDHARARALVQQMAAALEAPDLGPWICAACGEENDPTFDACWQCGHEHAP
jgi:hypothetical protein